jgi:hypothetical protein
MPKKKNSSGLRKLSKGTDKETLFGRDLIAGAKQLLAHVEMRKVMKEYALPMPIDRVCPEGGGNPAQQIS